MSANQDPTGQQMMYQQQSYAGYQPATNSMGTWGQPQQQTMPYAVPYHGDVTSYADKAGYGGAYPPLQQFAGGEADYFRYAASAQPFPQTQQTGQWAPQQTNYQQTYATQQPAYGVYSAGVGDRDGARGAAFNPGAPPPNMNRPPPTLNKRENQNGENTFHATLSMLENPAQNSAAYTASWVSSTSSIPPELKDEPEFGALPREDIGNNVFSGNFQEQFNNMSIHDNLKQSTRGDVGQWDESKQSLQPQQWPGLGQSQQQEEARQKKQERERNQRPREEARVMTWDERVRKARAQAERAEQRSTGDRGADGARGGFGAVSRGGRGGGPSTRGFRNEGRSDRPRDRDGQTREWKGENGDNRHQNGTGDLSRGAFRGRGTMQTPRGGSGIQMGAPAMHPMFGQPPLMMPPRGGSYMRGGPHPPPPPHMMNVQQDERFKNTWLDASVYVQPFPMPFPPMSAFGMDPRFGNRGRGRGGPRGMRGGYGNGSGKRDRRDDDRKEAGSGSGTPATSNEESASPSAEAPMTESATENTAADVKSE